MKTPDEKDLELLAARIERREQLSGPRIGDFVQMLDGTTRRFTHDWGDVIQTTVGNRHPCFGDVSFYIDRDGYSSFSGSLDAAINKTKIVEVYNAKYDGKFWFFHHDYATAHNGVSVIVPCRVFEQIA